MKTMNVLDRSKGCLIGGAAGDALGYTVEFLSLGEILKRYGEKGITEYSLRDGVAQISDDTQMTLFTANGLFVKPGKAADLNFADRKLYAVREAYKEWNRTQCEKFSPDRKSRYVLMKIRQLFSRRAPGGTCLTAITNGANGTLDNPINNSKGCGGVMRVAPIGLYFGDDKLSRDDIDMLGARAAALTHGHELGYIPAAALVHLISVITYGDENLTLFDAVLDMKAAISRLFAGAEHLPEQIALIDKAIALSKEDMEDFRAIYQLGAGWVAEETLAIAIYCALKYSDDFEKAITAAVNHGGDSDSTGAVTGNILGAYLGIGAIPDKYIEHLELKNLILKVAERLCTV